MKYTTLFIAFSTFVLHQTSAFRVETTDVAPPADIVGEHQEFEKTWNVYNAQALEKLKLEVPGPVFVYYDASVRNAIPPNEIEAPENETETSSSSSNSRSSFNELETTTLATSAGEDTLVAKMVVTGNATALMKLYEVLPLKNSASNDGIHVHLTNTDATAAGYVLTYIYVTEPAIVRTLSMSLPSAVVVGCNVLVRNSTTSKLKLANAGAGCLFIHEIEPMDVKTIHIDVAGSGATQLNLSSLTASHTISSSIAGSGTVAFHTTDLNTSNLATSISGSGSLFVVTKTLTTTKVTTSVYGNSMVSFAVSEAGQTDKQALTIAGSGSIYAGSVVSTTASVDMWGSGVVYVQARDQLSVSSISGEVFYVGEKPHKVESNKWFFWTSPVKPALNNQLVNHTLVETPTFDPEFVSLQLKQNKFSVDPIVWKLVDHPTLIQNVMMNAKITSIVHGPNGLVVFGGIAFGLLMVAMVAHGYQQRRVRRQYTPLV